MRTRPGVCWSRATEQNVRGEHTARRGVCPFASAQRMRSPARVPTYRVFTCADRCCSSAAGHSTRRSGAIFVVIRARARYDHRLERQRLLVERQVQRDVLSDAHGDALHAVRRPGAGHDDPVGARRQPSQHVLPAGIADGADDEAGGGVGGDDASARGGLAVGRNAAAHGRTVDLRAGRHHGRERGRRQSAAEPSCAGDSMHGHAKFRPCEGSQQLVPLRTRRRAWR